MENLTLSKKKKKKNIVISIAGAHGVGKSTIYNIIKKIVADNNKFKFFPERYKKIPPFPFGSSNNATTLDIELLKIECWFMDLLKIVDGYAIGKNEETEIATLSRSNVGKIVGQDYFKLFEDIYVKIEFKDIYGKKFNIKIPMNVHEHDAEWMFK